MSTLTASIDPRLWWDVSRACGLLAWFLAVAAVLSGLLAPNRALTARGRPGSLHRFLGALCVIFVAGHVVGVYLQSYIHFDAGDLFVPGASVWQPTPVTWGIVSLYLVIAVEVASLVMARLPRWAWRAVHVASYPLFISASLHLLTAGSDREDFFVRGSVVLAGVAVMFSAIYRVLAVVFGERERPRPPQVV